MFDALIEKLDKAGKIQEGYNELLKLKDKSEITVELLEAIFLLEIKLKLNNKAFLTIIDILEINPLNSIAWANKANLLNEFGNLNDALECINRAIELNNKISTNYSNRSNILIGLNKYQDALKSCNIAIEIDERNKDGWMNKANILFELNDFISAKINAEKAVEIDPEYTAAWLNLGRIYNALHDYNGAIACYEKCLKINEKFVQAYINLGYTYGCINKISDALQMYQKAKIIDREVAAEIDWNMSLLHLTLGEYKVGWNLYESRWKMKEFIFQKKELNSKRLDSKNTCSGKHIFIYSEQGFGDCIQMSRFLLNLIDVSKKLTFQCHHTLIPLIKTISNNLDIISFNDEIPEHDYHLPLMSLPKILEIYSEGEIFKNPYLRVPVLNSNNNITIENNGYIKIGVAWSGSSNHKNDSNRSIELNLFKNFIKLWNNKFSFYSIQKEYKKDEIEILKALRVQDLSSNLNDFGVTANLIAQLDLVITVDTAVAHVAASIGKPTWLLLSNPSDFRWLLHREDSPWYPTIKLYKQPTPGDWLSVFDRLNKELSKKLQIE